VHVISCHFGTSARNPDADRPFPTAVVPHQHLNSTTGPTIPPIHTLAPQHCASDLTNQSAKNATRFTRDPTAMITSGFTNAPVSQFLVFGTVIGALLASLTDTRYYIHIQVVPHLWSYKQFWRILTWQVSLSWWVLRRTTTDVRAVLRHASQIRPKCYSRC
jgi:hypothetical protein